MIKVCFVVMSGFLLPLLAWMLVPTLLCIAAVALLALPVVALRVAFTRPRRLVTDAPVQALPPLALQYVATPLFRQSSPVLPSDLAS